MTSRAEVEAFWARFLFVRGLPSTAVWKDCFQFGATPAEAERGLGLVLAGIKRATVTSLAAFQQHQLRPPCRGDLSIVTDSTGAPRCVVQTTGVTILAYRDMPAALALAEGEDDTLEGWRIRQRNFLMAEGEALRYLFSPDQQLVVEEFRVVYEDTPV